MPLVWVKMSFQAFKLSHLKAKTQTIDLLNVNSPNSPIKPNKLGISSATKDFKYTQLQATVSLFPYFCEQMRSRYIFCE